MFKRRFVVLPIVQKRLINAWFVKLSIKKT